MSAVFPTHRRALDILLDVLESSLQPRNLCQQGIVGLAFHIDTRGHERKVLSCVDDHN